MAVFTTAQPQKNQAQGSLPVTSPFQQQRNFHNGMHTDVDIYMYISEVFYKKIDTIFRFCAKNMSAGTFATYIVNSTHYHMLV